MAKQVRANFLEECIQASELERDTRFRAWAKWVDAVDPEGKNGYAFEGDFIKEGTIELDVGAPRVILVSTGAGSRKYQTRYYAVIVLEADGTLRQTDIHTTDVTLGWALRIRDKVSHLITSFAATEGTEVVSIAQVLDYLGSLRLEPLMKQAGLQVTDWDDVTHLYEVQHKNDRRWLELHIAAEFIAAQINSLNRGQK